MVHKTELLAQILFGWVVPVWAPRPHSWRLFCDLRYTMFSFFHELVQPIWCVWFVHCSRHSEWALKVGLCVEADVRRTCILVGCEISIQSPTNILVARVCLRVITRWYVCLPLFLSYLSPEPSKQSYCAWSGPCYMLNLLLHFRGPQLPL